MALPLCLALLVSLPGQGGEPAPPPRPNVVLIVADDLGYGELGCYGQQKIQTPRLDAMAKEGLRFTQFYAAAPVCAPARCSLMTGLHGGHAYVRDNVEFEPEGQLALPKDTQTLPKLLQAAGYETAMIGKWGLGGPKTSGEPNAQGFDHWFGYYCQRQAQTYYPDHLWRDGTAVALEGNRADGVTGTQYSPDLFLAEAERFLRAEHEKPFFLYLPFTLPHVALQVEDEDLAPYKERFEETPYRGERGYLPHATPRAAYAAMISRLDRDVGCVLDLLKELRLEENTLVVFVSDNGPTYDAGGVDTRFFDSTAGLRGRKGQVYEGGIRVPLIARWPERVPAGKESAWIGAHYDLLPTLLELAGVAVPSGLDGLSFAAELRGAAAPAHEFLLWEFNGYGGQQAVRMGRWKGVRSNLQEELAPLELYDLEAAPRETKNVAAKNPEVVARMLEVLAREHKSSRDFPIPALDAPPTRSGGF
ncbi:MAG: arylsulfatase [Planctomycetes bacterium]|nr:arylsulfatase [Planctomycetota bacterium]